MKNAYRKRSFTMNCQGDQYSNGSAMCFGKFINIYRAPFNIMLYAWAMQLKKVTRQVYLFFLVSSLFPNNQKL